MVDAQVLETLARGVAVGGFVVMGLALLLDRRPTPLRWVGGLFFACAIAHVIDGFRPDLVVHRNAVIWGMSVATTGLFWAMAYALFADARFSFHRLWPTAGLVILWAVARSLPLTMCRPFWLTLNLVSLGLVLHALVLIWRGWRGDLVAERRRLRGPVMLAAAGYILLLSLQDVAWVTGLPWFNASGLAQAIALAALSIASSAVLLQPEPVLVVEAPPEEGRPPQAAPSPAPDLTPADRLVLARLQAAMDQDEVWRGEDLSITALAALVGAPEHRLRRLINGVLGHRNFADYVNGRRIDAAKTALADPEQALKPVSTIAYELGFASLGPFNRAFRAETGLTPSAWRSEKTPAGPRLVEIARITPKPDKSA